MINTQLLKVTPIESSTDQLITGEEFAEMSDLGPSELVRGRIVRMTPPKSEHGYYESEVAAYLRTFVKAHNLGWILSGEAGIYTSHEPDTVRGMDVAFISRQRQSSRPKGYLAIPPELIVEIVSPTDRWRDIRDKIDEYFAIGVDRVWIVEPEKRTVLVFHSTTDLTKLTEGDVLQGEGLLTGFELPLTDLFAE